MVRRPSAIPKLIALFVMIWHVVGPTMSALRAVAAGERVIELCSATEGRHRIVVDADGNRVDASPDDVSAKATCHECCPNAGDMPVPASNSPSTVAYRADTRSMRLSARRCSACPPPGGSGSRAPPSRFS